MSDFKSRLIEEKEQVRERSEKLFAFIDSEKVNEIDPMQKALLSVQYHAMLTYKACLNERIALLEAEVEQK